MYGMKDILKVVGIYGIFIAGCILASIAMILWDKHKLTKGFDERQMMHRGRGCTLGYFAFALYHLIVMIWDVFDPITWSVQQFAAGGVLVGGMTAVTYLMLTDSWAKFNEKTWWVGPCFFLTGAMQIVNFNRLNESLLVQVQLGQEIPQTRHFTILLCGLCMIYYGLLHLLCHWWHNRE